MSATLGWGDRLVKPPAVGCQERATSSDRGHDLSARIWRRWLAGGRPRRLAPPVRRHRSSNHEKQRQPGTTLFEGTVLVCRLGPHLRGRSEPPAALSAPAPSGHDEGKIDLPDLPQIARLLDASKWAKGTHCRYPDRTPWRSPSRASRRRADSGLHSPYRMLTGENIATLSAFRLADCPASRAGRRARPPVRAPAARAAIRPE